MHVDGCGSFAEVTETHVDGCGSFAEVAEMHVDGCGSFAEVTGMHVDKLAEVTGMSTVDHTHHGDCCSACRLGGRSGITLTG